MNQLLRGLTATVLGFATTAVLASPSYLVTHNRTNVESNAYVAGTPSPEPTKANSDGKVHWAVVRMACYGHVDGQGRCPAIIKMATNTANPITLGMVSMHLETGDILPKTLSANGYTMIVNGPGEATLTKTK
ncbi:MULTISPECIES: hypothetical protein [unclassified Legionella]|uniref:hypothetical protein n=1 Tax=unclassified Legionella TaxID=2622702 RepID=UPI0010568A39|nr:MULTISPECIES: hypothetical protein [unclassified Legionella]MDI9819154.1 hypothetical protein [Legionella sp. PL877]